MRSPVALFRNFLKFAFLGWMLEAVWLRRHDEPIVKGPLHPLPLKPTYGFGGLIVGWFRHRVLNIPVPMQWLLLSLSLGAYETLAGVVSYALFRKKFWHYKNSALNVMGYTDAFHAAIWGLFGMGMLHTRGRRRTALKATRAAIEEGETPDAK